MGIAASRTLLEAFGRVCKRVSERSASIHAANDDMFVYDHND